MKNTLNLRMENIFTLPPSKELIMYIVDPIKKGGMYMNLDSTSASDDELYNEWKNKIIRSSIAKSSMMKIKRINGSHFFTKGKVQLLGDFIAENNV